MDKDTFAPFESVLEITTNPDFTINKHGEDKVPSSTIIFLELTMNFLKIKI